MSGGAPGSWYRSSFGPEYLEIYAHRDVECARAEVRFLAQALEIEPRARVLDLACGTGLHVGLLREAGYRAFGLDLSRDLLERARCGEGSPDPPLVRADMRALPFAPRGPVFDAVVSLFTSFGYFFEAADDLAVLRQVCRVLVPGGLFFLDTLNRERVLQCLEPCSVERRGDLECIQERRLARDGSRVEKRIVIRNHRVPGFERVFYESVHLYPASELRALFEGAGLSPQRSYGDFDGRAFGADSPRLILTGRRPR